ncbi:MAG: DUF2914 domain-containing protein [Endomicrobium sp.]|jgi:hypothetical protein|nr:DUF2914 domain-containing protein [Endomicrobium sp.]
MRKLGLLLSFAVLFGVSAAAFAQEEETKAESALKVSESAVCTAISDRQPEGTASEFSKDVAKIYYWTRIDGASGDETVKHVWYAGDNVIGEVSLNIKTPSYRTWSSKTVYPGLEGDLSVAVVDAEGNVLKKDAFKIQ